MQATDTLTEVKQYYQQSTCQCEDCRWMCHTPCWGTPDEIKVLMDKYPLDYFRLGFYSHDYKGISHEFTVICPKKKKSEDISDTYLGIDSCIFMNKSGNCVLHNKKLKPIEGRFAHHTRADRGQNKHTLRLLVAKSWETEQGKELVHDFVLKTKYSAEQWYYDYINQ